MPLLIGITGKALSGKDTLATILFQDHEFLQMAFAIPLKNAASAAFGVPLCKFHSQEGKAEINSFWETTNRVLLQDFGETMCQAHGPNFWIKRWMLDYANFQETDNVVVSDVRKDVEAEFIRQMGGTIIHISRDGSGLSGEEGKHITEMGVMQVVGDILIQNNGSIEDLRRIARDAVFHIQSVKERK